MIAHIAVHGKEEVTVTICRDTSAAPMPEATDDASHSFAYTGKHDNGPLPPIRTDNMYGHLVDALQEAKVETDKFMVALVAEEAATGAAKAPPPKVNRNLRCAFYSVNTTFPSRAPALQWTSRSARHAHHIHIWFDVQKSRKGASPSHEEPVEEVEDEELA